MNVLELVEDIAKKKGFRAVVKGNVVEIDVGEVDVPLKLIVKRLDDNSVEISLSAGNLRDYIEDLRDAGEDFKEVIIEHIGDLKNIARTIITELSGKDIKIVDKLRESELDITDMIEEESEE